MKLKKPQRKTLKQKDRGVVLNSAGLEVLLQRVTFKGSGKKEYIKMTAEKLLTGVKPKDEFEWDVLSQLRGMGLVRIDHTEVISHD